MAEMRVSFTLSDRDLKHLRRVMRQAGDAVKTQSEDQIVRAALIMAGEVRKFKPPQYVIDRIRKLELLVEVLKDKDYLLPEPVRRKVLAALCYFSNPHDLIPDTIPGLGFLDDAIMIELVAQDLRYELEAYIAFRSFRERASQRPWTRVGMDALEKKLAARRRALRRRVEERQAKALAGSKRRGFYRLW